MSDFSFDPVWYSFRYLDGEKSIPLAPSFHQEEGRALGYFSCCEEETEYYRKRARAHIVRGLYAPDRLIKTIERYRREHVRQRKGVVVFSAVSGNYDSLKLPANPDPKLSFLLFTDGCEVETGIWQLEPMPYFSHDPVRRTRYVKLHPHFLLKGFSVAVWIDQNVLLLDGLEAEIASFLASNLPLATFYHPTRSTVREEALACLSLKKDSEHLLLEQLKNYSQAHLDLLPLTNTNVVFYNLDHPDLPKVLAAWWRHLERYSRRDQIALSPALFETGTTFHPLAKKGIAPANHPKFGVLAHDRNESLSRSLTRILTQHQSDPNQGLRAKKIDEMRLRPGIGHIFCLTDPQTDLTPFFAGLAEAQEDDAFFLVNLCEAKLSTKDPRVEVISALRGGAEAMCRAAERSAASVLLFSSAPLVVPKTTACNLCWALDEEGIALAMALSDFCFPGKLPLPVSKARNHVRALLTLMNKLLDGWATHSILRVPILEGAFACRKSFFTSLHGLDFEHFPQASAALTAFSLHAHDLGSDLALIPACCLGVLGQTRTSAKADEALDLNFGQERLKRARKSLNYHPDLLELRRKAQCFQL